MIPLLIICRPCIQRQNSMHIIMHAIITGIHTVGGNESVRLLSSIIGLACGILAHKNIRQKLHSFIIYHISTVSKIYAKRPGWKVVKYRWQPRNSCDGSLVAKKFNSNNSGKFLLPHPMGSFSRNPHCNHFFSTNHFYFLQFTTLFTLEQR